MKKQIQILLVFLLISFHTNAQNTANKYAETITQQDLKDYLTILASDALEGRETGTRGQKMAAAFIQEHFKSNGLKPVVQCDTYQSFLQPVPLEKGTPGDIYIKIDGDKKINFKDIVYHGSLDMPEEESIEVVFGGEGKETDLEGLDLQGKGVVIFTKIETTTLREKLQRERGVRAFFVVNTNDDKSFGALASQYKFFTSGGLLHLKEKQEKKKDVGVFFISPNMAAEILHTKAKKLKKAIKKKNGGKSKALKKIKPKSIAYKLKWNVEKLDSENVLGYLEGTDKKEEVVVLTAHFDHLGKMGDQIYNGADDDGSGTVAIMEIAQAFADAKKAGNGSRRSMLFMTVTGEEKGLLGSEYYTSNPIFPLENTVVDLNIDMIGRVDPKHKDNPDYVYLVGSDRLSSELHMLSEKVNETYTKLALDYVYNDENHPDRIYYRSDHWNFAKNNIPVIFYFNGVHADYHQPTDTADKIDFDQLHKRTLLVFYTAWEIANRENRLKVDKAAK